VAALSAPLSRSSSPPCRLPAMIILVFALICCIGGFLVGGYISGR
jgi:hypothetical protein